MMIDLYDWEAGSLCNVCWDSGSHAPATLRDSDLGPVCDDCMVMALRAERFLRGSVADGRAA